LGPVTGAKYLAKRRDPTRLPAKILQQNTDDGILALGPHDRRGLDIGRKALKQCTIGPCSTGNEA